MEQCKKDIAQAKELIKAKEYREPCFSTYCSTFLFGTENQEGINQVIEYKDKDVCTVASSGDQYVSAVYYGAGKVDIYDINRFTYYITCLKVASIVCLDYKEFMDFLVPVHDKEIEKTFWSLKTLKKVIKFMPSDVAYFWDNIMYECKKYGFDGDFVVPQHKHANKCYVIKGMPFYASEEEYYKLQSLLRKREFPKFYESDLLSLSSVVTDTYDVMYLSNIIECLVSSELCSYPFSRGFNAENEAEERYIFDVAKEVIPRLRKNGVIMLSYRGNASKEYSTDLLYNTDYFDVTEVDSKYPASDEYNKCYDTDLVLSYKPNKTGNILDLLNKR